MSAIWRVTAVALLAFRLLAMLSLLALLIVFWPLHAIYRAMERALCFVSEGGL